MGITTGIVPAAAMLGMLLGFGLRDGAPAAAFEALGAALFGAGALTGALVVVVVGLLCGVAYISAVARQRQHWMIWAIAIGAAVAVILLLCRRATGGGFALVLSAGNSIEIGVVIAFALPIGMRFALPQV